LGVEPARPTRAPEDDVMNNGSHTKSALLPVHLRKSLKMITLTAYHGNEIEQVVSANKIKDFLATGSLNRNPQLPIRVIL
jgi:hypothetical protein